MKNIPVYAIIFLMCANMVFATTIKSDEKDFKITYPEVINPFEPFTVNVKVLDNDLKTANRLEIRYGSIPLIEGEDFNPSSDLKVVGSNNGYIYNGEKSFDIQVSLLQSGGMGLNDMYRGYKETSDLDTEFTIFFLSDEEGVIDSVEAPIKSYPYDISISLPSKYVYEKKDSDLNKLTKTYKVQNDNEDSSVKVKMMLPLALEPKPHFISLKDLQEGRPTSNHWINSGVQYIEDDFEKNSFTMNGYPAILYSRCFVGCMSEDDDQCNYGCEFVGQQATDLGIIRFDMSNNKGLEAWLPRDIAEIKINDWQALALNAFRSIKYDATGHNHKEKTVEEKDEGECESNSDCSDDKVCNACGKCVKNAIDPANIETKIELKNKLSSKSIYNSVREQMLITTKIIPTFIYDGKKIDYCDISAPGIKKELVAEMKNPDPYAGFLLRGDILNEERTKTQKTILDFSEKPLEYHFLISPNDKKKEIGSLGKVIENIEIKIEGLATTNEKLTLKPIDLSIGIKSGGVQLQEDSNKLMSIKVKDKYAKHIYFKASVIGPGELELGEASFKKVYTNTKPGELIKLMYYSPEMGNFDIGKELASLSMVNLQKDAAKQIAEDAVLAYAGDAFQDAEDLHNAETAAKNSKAGINAVRGFLSRNPGKYNPAKVAEYVKKFSSASQNSKKIDLAAKSFKLYSGTYGLSQIPKGTVSMRDDMKQVIDQGKNKDVNSRKTWTESVAEYGIVGIDIAQTGMSILTFIPSKIPGVKSINAGFKTAFSAMTNIWKANLLYVAKDEKIGRAKEHLYPIMILVTAEDESGWQLTQGYILQVAFHEI